MAIGDNNNESAQKYQMATTEVQRSTRKWRIKLKKTKSVHIDFTNQRVEHKPIYINHHAVPYENTAKYLGMTMDTKLRRKPHVKKKTRRTQSEIQKKCIG
jgi:hypothetical protein